MTKRAMGWFFGFSEIHRPLRGPCNCKMGIWHSGLQDNMHIDSIAKLQVGYPAMVTISSYHLASFPSARKMGTRLPTTEIMYSH